MSTPALSGGSSAPSVSPSQGNPGATQPQRSAPTEGGFDVEGAFKEARTARKETQQLRSGFDRTEKELKETRQVMDRVKQAFVPENAPKSDPFESAIEEANEQMDYYIEQAMEAKSKGGGIPLTTNLAIRQFQAQIDNIKFQQKVLAQLEALQGGVKQANDPEVMVNNGAYTAMETSIQDQLDQLYGNDQQSFGVKKQMYHSVVSLLQANLKELQTKAPGQWDMVRRDPNKLRQMVQAAVRQVVPPRAMQLIENEQLKNTPMKSEELWAAFREAKTINDPAERKRLRESIRRDILEDNMARMKRRR